MLASMRQLNLRVPEQLAADLKRAAADQGRSVNALATDGLRALVDPEFAGEEADRIRERLRQAGLLVRLEPMPGAPPDAAALKDARRAAGRGRSLSDYVTGDRGDR